MLCKMRDYAHFYAISVYNIGLKTRPVPKSKTSCTTDTRIFKTQHTHKYPQHPETVSDKRNKAMTDEIKDPALKAQLDRLEEIAVRTERALIEHRAKENANGERIGALEIRFGTMEHRFSGLEARFGVLENRVHGNHDEVETRTRFNHEEVMGAIRKLGGGK